MSTMCDKKKGMATSEPNGAMRLLFGPDSDGRNLTGLRGEPSRDLTAEDSHDRDQRNGDKGNQETVFCDRYAFFGAEKLLHRGPSRD